MAQKTAKKNHEEEIIGWEIEEFEQHERTKQWYIYAIIIALFLLLFSFITGNFLFPVIIITAALIIILNDGKTPMKLRFGLTEEGIKLGNKFYDYDEIKNFAVVYKPRIHVKNLYIEFKGTLQHRLSIPLGDNDPLLIRDNLIKYLSEDLDRTDLPLSESIAKILKI
ncbi:hypothetical protein K8R32_00930 [bacterium]|nr:hypothetical protein [bacterium]